MAMFPFLQADSRFGESSLMPLLPIQLSFHENSMHQLGLLDTGATVNVLPYRIGLELGAVWDRDRPSLRLTGNLANFDAQGIMARAVVGDYQPVNLVFAWTRAENAPLILGQMNFFAEFDVCFFRSQLTFEVQPKNTS